MTGTSIDGAAFEELQQTAGAEFVTELVDTFLTEAPLMLAELHSALADGNSDRFRRAAHSLKSNSNTFGATALGAMARELELTAADRVAAGDTHALDALAEEYGRVAAALKELSRA
jgi:HPt (histidine-containing phosphotransfer) domain-containing protein